MVEAAHQQQPPALVFDAARLSSQADIPQQFLWPADESPTPDAAEELPVPLIDLSGGAADAEVVRQVGEACELHGFFQVVNHGIDQALLAEAHRCMDAFFTLPLHEKQRAQRRQGESCGYASSFTGRFASKLPWKETLPPPPPPLLGLLPLAPSGTSPGPLDPRCVHKLPPLLTLHPPPPWRRSSGI
jgi:gibberellin 20-oxidase